MKTSLNTLCGNQRTKCFTYFLVVLSLLLLAGCGLSREERQAIKTIQEFEERQKKVDECNKMPDGVDCIECGGIQSFKEYEKGIYPEGYEQCGVCNSIERYNAEVERQNECLDKFPSTNQ